MPKNIKEVIKDCKDYATGQGFSLNSNERIVEAVVKGLLEREEKFGQRYCPCRRITNRAEEDQKIVCPCAFHLAEIEKDGQCLCRLFVKKMIK